MPRYKDYNYDQSAMVVINFKEQIQPGTFEYAVHYLTDNKLDLSLFDEAYKNDKNCRLAIRHFRHVKKRSKAKKALTRLRTIANKLIRELQCKLPTHLLFETYQKDFLFYQHVLAQQPKDKNKIYSLHEPNVYVIAKGKDHKQYETFA